MQCPVSAAATDKHSKNIPKLSYWIVGLVNLIIDGAKVLFFVYVIVEGDYQRAVKSFMFAFRILYHKMPLN